MNALGNAIRAARLKRGLSQVELATSLSVSQTTISFWENGVETPSFRNLIRLAVAAPELTVVIEDHELNLLDRLRELERQARGTKCSCANCACSPERLTG